LLSSNDEGIMSRLSQTAALAIALAMITAACATSMNVSSHVRRGLDIGQYHSYAWGPADALPTGDPRLDQNPYFRDYLQGAVERQLAARGIRASTSDPPDLLIHYHASIDSRIDVSRSEREYESCRGADCSSWVQDYEAGTLVLDVVDARTNRLIWRGWAQDSVGAFENRERMAAKIAEAVRQMMATFPRPGGDARTRANGGQP
jgi:hypothetical protein